MATLRERVGAILTRREGTEEERVHQAIEEVAHDVDEVSTRLAVIDPEWELLARAELDEPWKAA